MSKEFNVSKTIGQHNILKINTEKHMFLEYFQKLFNTIDLENLHKASIDYKKLESGEIKDICDYETDIHKLFYKDIKENDTFKTLYCNLIKEIHKNLFSNEEYLIYQSFPSVRFQFPNSIAVPPHYDSDKIGNHPLGEKNFLLPITSMYKSKRLFIETNPNDGNFCGIDLDYGDLFYFNGNTCTHYNEKNIENSLRISLDFRIMNVSDYKKYILNGNIVTTNPRDPDKKRTPTKMIIGGYYQITHINDTLDIMKKWHFQKDLLLQSRPCFDENEANACHEYMSNDNFVTEFKYTEQLETTLAKFIGTKHCIMTTSGNNAIILALLALNIQKDDEVIVPNYTMIATINSIKMIGATPVIVDVDKDALTLSVDTIKSAITNKTKAVLHVSLNNRHKDIISLQLFCKSHNIILVEDAAQSLGCFVNKKHFGTFGEIGCFSLSTPKIISTGQGGFVITDNDHLAKQIRMIKNFGRKEGGIDNFETFGINMKFTDIQAVIGIEQMKKIDYRIKRLREIFDLYYAGLSKVCTMIKPIDESWIPWFVDIFIDKRDELVTFLKQHNIQSRVTYPEINKTPMYFSENIYPISNYISNNGLFLPTHMMLTNEQINYICNIINIYYKTT